MGRTETPWGPWDPASPAQVARLFGGRGLRWWIAGGYAIEFAVGRTVRGHGDIDVLVLRPDHLAVQDALERWQWWAADPPGTLRPWPAGERLPAAVHDIWCRPAPDQPWRIQIMVDEADGDHWVSRRDCALRRPADRIGALSADGIPYLVPEIQLYYKAKGRRPKDEQDFDAALPHLDAAQRRWLGDALTRAHGSHPWIDRLHTAAPGP